MSYVSRATLAILSLLFCKLVIAQELKAEDDVRAGKQDTEVKTQPASNIVVVSHAIFDESDPDAFFIHRWANYLHINTRESTTLNHLSFEKNQAVTQKDLDEAQRILRKEPYIRDAKVSFAEADPEAESAPDGSQSILVETWDNWSLLPTFSAGRSGGENTFSAGLKEDNLLGYGIRTRLKYQSDANRTGYKLAFRVPMDSLARHSTLSVNFYDNSDGEAAMVDFTKPFYTLDDTNMYSTTYVNDLRVDTIRQNGMDINEFEHKIDYANLQYGWRINKQDDWRTRLSVGITQDKNQFDNIVSFPNSPLPQDRDFLYPWVSFQYLQDDFRVLNNVHLINKNEDFNLGWQHYIKLGFETLDTGDSSPVGYHLNLFSSRGFQQDDHLLMLALKGEGTFATTQADYFKATALAEYFYQIAPKWTAYSKVRLSTSKNNYLDRTFAMGDETGVRGYPNDYQHGDNQWLVTAELRNYPNLNLYQIAELGWALFTDYGQASGGPDQNNETTKPIGSIGIGARIYSSRSSYGNVAHIDFSMPYNSGEHVNSWEWRFQVKNHF
ncbi:ShlB/FhaC/HecB family hemolysin secretion/activation protein [Shewanella sp. Isolate11]|uniref:ShlB/FhaC/HecB family hemolysin secretion/activation protein n=1 Tax=Shewanella sp. Isolate11 TaxID=2908530 RepID=UPI001EFE7495|nr:ShlB/FhaC/HecB family hemolysin secretion/activation protein [Shewanella sp. Isolate11]MCG9695382.1 hypothetical protein [Shewanella sp. Isolate11]